MIGTNSFYDRAYNTRIGVDNVPAIFDRWAQDSESARRNLTCHLNLRYGEANRETIDLFPAENSNRWLIFIHGGYWRKMAKDDHSFIAPPFVTSGWNVALIEYDLCPQVTIETITNQCRRAIAWLYHHANEFGQTPAKIVVSGHSAGGHLTAMMFATDWETYNIPSETFIGGVAISGLFDLDPISQTAMNDDLQLTCEDVLALSPMRLSPHVKAPLVLTVGELESSEFHRQNELLRGAAGWGDLTTETIVATGCHHFNILDQFMLMNSSIWQAATFIE